MFFKIISYIFAIDIIIIIIMKIELMIYVSILKISIKLGKFRQFNIYAITIIAKKYIIISRYSVRYKETIKNYSFPPVAYRKK